MQFLSHIKQLYAGHSLLRAMMNESFRAHMLRGMVVDIGGGRNPDYFFYLKREGEVVVTTLDGSLHKIDFEKDALPYANGSIDTLVCANLLEHIYNYRFLVGEMRRVLKKGGQLIGFVPFFQQYHPDPHDYFRYTKEALCRIFIEAGFTQCEIKEVGGGPFLVHFNNIHHIFPRPLRPVAYLLYALIDSLYLAIKPSAKERYPIGYTFVAR